MERRRGARRIPSAGEPLAYARLRTGHQLTVIDASNWGVLTESTERLLPGRHLDVHVVTPDGRVLVRGRVARAYVCLLQSDAIHYRAALAFDRPIDTEACACAAPSVLASLPNAQGTPDQNRGDRSDIVFDERLVS